MKNLSLILNVVLAVAVAILFYLHFSSQACNEPLPEKNVVKDSAQVQVSPDKAFKFAYVNIDSLLANYNFHNVMQKQLQTRYKQSEAQLQAQVKNLEKDVIAYQEKASRGGFLTQQTQQAAQTELMQKEQNIKMLERSLSEKLMKEQQAMDKQLTDTVMSFLKVFNKDSEYDLILRNTFGDNVLYSIPNYNITDTILNGLNARYAEINSK